MMDFLRPLTDFCILAFVVSSMLSMGLSQRWGDVFAPWKDPKFVGMALIINFGLAPLWAYLLCRLIPLQPAHAIGLLLLGGAAGAPALPKLAQIANSNRAYAIGLMVLLMGGSILFIPLVLPFILPECEFNPLQVARPLILWMGIPLVLGFGLAHYLPRAAAFLMTGVRWVSNLTFAALLVLIIGLNFRTLAGTFGSFAIGTYGVFVLGLLVMGYFLGGPDPATRRVFALGAGLRNIEVALVVTRTGFNDPALTVMLIVAAAVGLVLLVTTAAILRRKTPCPGEPVGT